MKNMLFASLALLSASILLAEPPSPPDAPPEPARAHQRDANGPRGQNDGPRGAGREMPPPPGNFGNFVGKMAATPEFAREVGLSPAQQAALSARLAEITTNSCAIESRLLAALKRQAALSRTILETPGVDSAELFAAVEEIGRCRTEQAKLSMRALLVLRDVLEDSQRQKARDCIRSAARKRMMARRGDRFGQSKKDGANSRPDDGNARPDDGGEPPPAPPEK